MKFIKFFEIKYIILFIILIFLSFKINLLKNLSQIFNYKYSERIEKIYGFCGGESIGYLKYVKSKYNIKGNPKIVNYIHTPPVLWSIYDVEFNKYKSNEKIILNYPGNFIHVELDSLGNSTYEFKDPYYFSTISNSIKKIYSNNTNLKIDELEFYKNDFSDYSNLLKQVKLNLNQNNGYELEIDLDEFKINENKLYIKIISDEIYDKASIVKLELVNKINLNEYKIIDKHKNCYYLKR